MSEAAITLASKEFSRVVSIASQALERRNTIPILSMLRCRANGSFEASGTDLDVTITARIDHGGGPKGDFILPEPQIVAKAIAIGGGGSVVLTPVSGKVALSSGDMNMIVHNSLAADDFPHSASDMASEEFTSTLSHAQLRSLARIASAISREETRYYLNGIYIHHVDGNTYRAVATDGHRLCAINLELPDAVGALPGIIVPRKALRLVLSLAGTPSPKDAGARLVVGSANLPNRETTTAPERSGNSTRARIEVLSGGVDVTLATKLIDGTFPDYSRVIPAGDAKSFVFKSDELRRAVEVASCGAKKARAVKLLFDAKGAAITTHYVDTGIDSAVRVPCDHRHAGFEVGFNGEYLLAMIEAAGPGEFVINTEDASSPALIKNPADTAWTGVLMPMRV